MKPARTAAAACALLVGVVTSGFDAGTASASQPATWNFTQADVPAAQPLGNDGAGVTVAVVDTGVDATHPEFEGRVLTGADCSSGACVTGNSGPTSCDGSWHGTHVAGTVASRDYGVAPQATILPVRVLTGNANSSCSGTSTGIAAGITWATDHGAQVINLSLGSDLPPGVAAAVDRSEANAVSYAAGKGVVVVFAAGNSSYPITDSYGTNALMIAATGPDGSIAGYSQSGIHVSLAAPGGDCPTDLTGNYILSKDCAITSTYPGNALAFAIGTSMATPHVSGLAALLLAENPGISRTDVINAMTSTAAPLPGAGSGLIDAARALRLHPGPGKPAGSPTQQVSDHPSSAHTVSPPQPFIGCPSVITARRGQHARVSCRVSPGGGIVRLQQRTGRGWVTISTVRSARGGGFRAYTTKLTGRQTLRLVYGHSIRGLCAALR